MSKNQKIYLNQGDNNSIYSAMILPSAYFDTCLMILDYIKKNYTEYSNSKSIFINQNITSRPTSLFDPMLYNFKHGVELYCKTIIVSEGKVEDTHNIEELFKKTISSIDHKNITSGGKILYDFTIQQLIQNIISKFGSNDKGNTLNRYPNTENYILCVKTLETKEEIENMGHYFQPHREQCSDNIVDIDDFEFYPYHIKYTREIPGWPNGHEKERIDGSTGKEYRNKIDYITNMETTILKIKIFFEQIIQNAQLTI